MKSILLLNSICKAFAEIGFMTVTKRMAICGKQSNSLKRKKNAFSVTLQGNMTSIKEGDRKFVRIVMASKESSREL